MCLTIYAALRGLFRRHRSVIFQKKDKALAGATEEGPGCVSKNFPEIGMTTFEASLFP